MNHNEAEDYLAHYGKLGMKWGRRNAPILQARASQKALRYDLQAKKAEYKSKKALDPKMLNKETRQARSAYKGQKGKTNAYTKQAEMAKRYTNGERAALGVILAVGAVRVSSIMFGKNG